MTNLQRCFWIVFVPKKKHLLKPAKSNGTSTNPSFLDGIILIMKSEELPRFASMKKSHLIGGLLLHDGAGAGLDDGNRDHIALFVKDLCHADFLTDDCFLHVISSLQLVVGQ